MSLAVREFLFGRSSRKLTLSEGEFFAENTLITILPEISSDRNLELISGQYPRFKKDRKMKVPIWLAVMLRRKKRCRIVPPEWMTERSLQEWLDKENPPNASAERVLESQTLEPTDFYYAEIAKIVLKHAEDEFRDTEKIRMLLEDIQQVRAQKIRKYVGLAIERDDVQMLMLENIASIEIAGIRHFMTATMDTFKQIGEAAEAVDAGSIEEDTTQQEESVESTGRQRKKLRRFQRA